MDIFVIAYSLLFYGIGRWVKSSPSVMAGYYTIPKEHRERVARQTADCFYRVFRVFRVMAVLMVVAHGVMRLAGVDKVLSGCLSTLVISVVGTVGTALWVQRYNH